MKNIIIICALIMIYSVISAQTQVSGQVSGIWSVDNQPYEVVDNIYINNGDTLRIEGGVHIKFTDDYSFTIFSDAVLFSTSFFDPDSIYFEPSGDSTIWVTDSWSLINNGNVQFRRTVLQFGDGLIIREGSSFVLGRYSNMQNPINMTGGCVAASKIVNNYNDGIKIDTPNSDNIFINNNTIKNNNGYGIHYEYYYNWNGTLSINSCSLTKNISGITIIDWGVVQATFEINDCLINDNNNIGIVYVEDYGYNLFSINQTEIINNGSIGIFVEINFGYLAVVIIQYCSLFNNGTSYDLYNMSLHQIDCQYNYWGEQTLIEMNSFGYPYNITRIHDYYDSQGLGICDYQNWLQAPLIENPIYYQPVDSTNVAYPIRIEEVIINEVSYSEFVEVGIFDGETIVGAGGSDVWPGQITVWGDNGILPGYTFGNQIQFKIWIPSENIELIAEPEFLVGDGTFGSGAYSKVSLTAEIPNPNLDADFNSDITYGFSELTVSFFDQSNPGTQTISNFDWNFGDSCTSYLQNPIHTYINSGIYTVTLTITDDIGVVDTEVKTSYITVYEADFSSDITQGLAPLTINFIDQSDQNSGYIINWEWSFGDDSSSFLQNPTHIYSIPGYYSVTLSVIDVNDSTDTKTKNDYITAYSTDTPAQVENVIINITGSDAIVQWSPTNSDINGYPLLPDGYVVLNSEIPDQDDYFFFLASVTDTVYTHLDVAQWSDQMFYKLFSYVNLSRWQMEYLLSLNNSPEKVKWLDLKRNLNYIKRK